MNRRNFMKLLGLTPFAGLLGCEVKLVAKKPDLPAGVKHISEYEGEFGHTEGIRWINTTGTHCSDGFGGKIRQLTDVEKKVAFRMKSRTIPFTEGEAPVMETFYFDELKYGKLNA